MYCGIGLGLKTAVNQKLRALLAAREKKSLCESKKRNPNFFDSLKRLGFSPSFLSPKLATERQDFIAAGFAPTDEAHCLLSDGLRLR